MRMNRKVFFVLLVVIMIAILGSILVMASSNKDSEVLFYDPLAVSVNGIPSADGHWWLFDGNYQIAYNDGQYYTLVVNNGSYHLEAINPATKNDDLVVFYDDNIVTVVGNEAESPHLWMLPQGIYQVTDKNGENRSLIVKNGSWYMTSLA
jgi:hypothetical protein